MPQMENQQIITYIIKQPAVHVQKTWVKQSWKKENTSRTTKVLVSVSKYETKIPYEEGVMGHQQSQVSQIQVQT